MSDFVVLTTKQQKAASALLAKANAAILAINGILSGEAPAKATRKPRKAKAADPAAPKKRVGRPPKAEKPVEAATEL